MIHGLTLETVDNYETLIPLLKELPVRVTLRIVLQPDVQISSYAPACRALSEFAVLMIQPVDSSAMAALTVEQYVLRFLHAVKYLGKYARIFECGNEINGSWCGEDVALKVSGAMNVTPNFERAITYYYDGDAPDQMREWAITHPIQRPDLLLVSVYPNSSAELPSLGNAFYELIEIGGGKIPVGLGEYGTEDADGNPSTMMERASLVDEYETYDVPVEQQSLYTGGGFYWDAAEDLPELLTTFHRVWKP